MPPNPNMGCSGNGAQGWFAPVPPGESILRRWGRDRWLPSRFEGSSQQCSLPTPQRQRSRAFRSSVLPNPSPTVVAAICPRRCGCGVRAGAYVLQGMSDDRHLAAVDVRSTRTTDPIALNLFHQLMQMDICDRRLVLVTLDGQLSGASSERVVLVRSAVERFQAETGQSLSKKRYERWRVEHPDRAALPSATLIAHTWNGSWANAMDKLGVRPAPDHAVRRMARLGVSPNDPELLDLLRVCAADLGQTPSVLEYRRWRQQQLYQHERVVFGEQTYRRRFGSWEKAIEAAGLPVRPRPRRTFSTAWTADDALGYLRTAASDFADGRLCIRQYDIWRDRHLTAQAAVGEYPAVPRGDSIAARYGGWMQALAAAGLISDRASAALRIGYGRSFSDAELDEALARFAREITGAVSSGAYQLWCESTMEGHDGIHLPGRTALGHRLGGWPNVAQRIREHRNAEKSS